MKDEELKQGFTIGWTSYYDAAIERDPEDIWKAEGGWAFKSREAAEAFLKRNQGRTFDNGGFTLDETFSVYRLDMPDGWPAYVDTEAPKHPEGAHQLIATALITKL